MKPAPSVSLSIFICQYLSIFISSWLRDLINAIQFLLWISASDVCSQLFLLAVEVFTPAGKVRCVLPCCISIWMRKSWFWFSYIDLNCVGWMSWFWCWWICIFHGLFSWWSVRYTIPGSHRKLWGVFVLTARRCLLSLHGLTRELLAV